MDLIAPQSISDTPLDKRTIAIQSCNYPSLAEFQVKIGRGWSPTASLSHLWATASEPLINCSGVWCLWACGCAVICYSVLCSVYLGCWFGVEDQSPAKSRDLLLGPCCVFDPYFVLLFGGGSRGGGSFGSFGATVPWNDSPRARGGPWAPPPRFDVSLHCSSLNPVCMCRGRRTLSGWLALQVLPFVWITCLSPLSFCRFHCFCVVAALCFFIFSLFLSGAGETQAPSWGLGFP